MNTLRGITGRSFAYSDGDHLLTAGGNIYEYDLDGFLENKTDDSGLTQYAYSSRGELLSVTLPDATLIEYAGLGIGIGWGSNLPLTLAVFLIGCPHV